MSRAARVAIDATEDIVARAVDWAKQQVGSDDYGLRCLSFVGIERDWGHVGIALGDGRMAHPWTDVRIDAIVDIPSLPSGRWSPPRYVGWAPPEVILRGSRRRS